ncbi:hypothetical protein DIE14_29730 [Burkholderia sp. Bp9017]|nr:hypothetical protein DIE14_29730 [Burkholderia sp. Bp9017]RQZ29438.1 hypothetical protein DIE13_26465 [Burkholderia sp. Bp9016]
MRRGFEHMQSNPGHATFPQGIGGCINMSENDTFETNTFGFKLPCRRFVIAAERPKERRILFGIRSFC